MPMTLTDLPKFLTTTSFSGRQAVRTVGEKRPAAHWFVAFPDAQVKVHAVHIVDDVAVEEGTFMGTQNGVFHGSMGDIPPTGRSVRVDYIQVLRFRDGKHVSFNLMFDQLMMLEQLGFLPTPSAAA